MHKLKRFRVISILTLFLFSFSMVEPYHAAAFDSTPWYTGGQAIGSGVNVSSQPQNSELQQEPVKNPCSAGDPVYLHSGEFYYECVDLTIPGRGMNVEIKHLYRSGKNYNGHFGYGWMLNYYFRLLTLDNGNVMIVSGDGRKDEYTYDSTTNQYLPPPGLFETLSSNLVDGSWTLTKDHGEKLKFDLNGNLIAMIDRNGNQITFSYDPGGRLPIIGTFPFTQNPGERIVLGYDYRLTKITDTVGRDINLVYNADGRLTTITDFAGRTVRFAYDSTTDDLISITKPITVQYPAGLTKSFQYTNHHLISITDPKNQVFVTNHYDAQGRVYQQDLGGGNFNFNYGANQTTVTDRKGFVTTYTFNAAGNATRIEKFTSGLRTTDPASFVTLNDYNADGLVAATTLPKGNGVKYTYDSTNPSSRAHGNLLEIRRKTSMTATDNDTNDIVTRMTYDLQFNQVKTITDPKGNVTTYTYDYELPTNNPKYATKGNLIYVDSPMVTAGIPRVEFSYNANGQPTQVKDPNGNITQYSYFTATGYLQSVTQDPSGINAVTQFIYDNFGNLDIVTDANNHTTNYDYNELGWLIQVTNPLTFVTKNTYDQNGNVTKVERQASNPAGTWQTTQFTYDVLNHLKTVTDPLNRTTTYNYDNNENLLSTVDAALKTTQYVYDERDLLFTTTDANSPAGVTQQDYDSNGNLAKITDANGNATNYTYDLFDRLDLTTYADLKLSNFDYDKNSNLTRHTTPSGKPIDYVYDELNRLTAKNFPQNMTLNTQYIYDLGSRMTDANNTAAQIHYAYDNLNRVITAAQTLNTIPYNIAFQYDKIGNRTKVTYPSGKVVDYTYDANDNMDLVKVNTATLVDYTYDTLDRRTQKSYISTTLPIATYSYDLGNQLSTITNKLVNNTAVSVYSYPLYDNVGNRKQLNRTLQTQATQSTNYTYNNKYELTAVSGAQTHSYDYDKVGNRNVADSVIYNPANSLNQYTSAGSMVFSYDNNGNFTSDGTNTYSYDEDNRLTNSVSTGNSTNYQYDAFNHRVSKTVNGTTTYSINDGDRVVEDRNASGGLIADYVYGTGIDEVLTMTRSGTTYYYHYDGLGSVTEITNASGTLVENYTYDVYGQPSVTNSTIGNRFMFTGREWDSESGTYYFRERQYSPTIGRFLQRDPVGYYDSMNLYQYVGNNPINYLDPLGLCNNGIDSFNFWDLFFDSKTFSDSQKLFQAADGDLGLSSIAFIGILATTADAGLNVATGGLKGSIKNSGKIMLGRFGKDLPKLKMLAKEFGAKVLDQPIPKNKLVKEIKQEIDKAEEIFVRLKNVDNAPNSFTSKVELKYIGTKNELLNKTRVIMDR